MVDGISDEVLFASETGSDIKASVVFVDLVVSVFFSVVVSVDAAVVLDVVFVADVVVVFDDAAVVVCY